MAKLKKCICFQEMIKRLTFFQPYPWDPVRTLFHNPKVNALPKIGYEVEVPEDQEYDPRSCNKDN